MNTSLSELLENLKQGLLWVGSDGVVRHANTLAGQKTGLSSGLRLYDTDMMRAVTEAVETQTPRVIKASGVAAQPGQAPAELMCRVIPGLVKDDAFVMIANDTLDAGGVAFNNLMIVVQEDLREPLRRAHDGLDMALQERDAAAVHVAQERSQDVLRVLDKLVDLAEVWGSASLMSTDRLELWPLLQKAWTAVEPLAVERSITARFIAEGDVTALATLYGSEQWLARVFQECLESAVRSTPKEGTLEIEHRQMGPRALIIFRDCGVFNREVAEGIPMLGTAAAAAPNAANAATKRRQAREEIGLQLSQHIVAMHGGLLREEIDHGVRTFMIDLPTGAPHRADTTQLDIAQAQQYAKDLAALMARARRRKEPPPATAPVDSTAAR